MKILVISQHLFPIQTPRAHRTTELVKELGRQGHEVTLYAVIGNHDYSELETGYNIKVKNIPIRFQKHPYNSDGDGKRKFIDKVLGRLLGKVFEFPNIEFLFRVPEIIQKEKGFDALITIADPHQIHWGAAKARQKDPINFPSVWIADCGDPFMMNSSKKGHFAYFAKYEKLFGQQCDFITVPVAEAKEGYYPEFRNKISIIPQGFQFSLVEEKQEPENIPITFAYAGTFYKDIRNPTKFLNILAAHPSNFKFVIYTLFTELIAPYQEILGSKLEIRSPLNRMELIEEMKKMDFLVNIENVSSPTQVPSKLIDYAIAQRPILSVNPINPDTTIIDQFLNRDYSKEFIVKNLEQYQISNIARKFVELIEEKVR
ncbi:MAG: hypothetical protein RI883_1853 [Bacteroidota bacterium]|jgi:hypothetical protein